MEPILRQSEILEIAAAMLGIDGDEVPADRGNAVEVSFLDGSMPPRRCCAEGCRVEIVGPPLVSQGLPYHPECYLKSRRKPETATLKRTA